MSQPVLCYGDHSILSPPEHLSHSGWHTAHWHLLPQNTENDKFNHFIEKIFSIGHFFQKNVFFVKITRAFLNLSRSYRKKYIQVNRLMDTKNSGTKTIFIFIVIGVLGRL